MGSITIVISVVELDSCDRASKIRTTVTVPEQFRYSTLESVDWECHIPPWNMGKTYYLDGVNLDPDLFRRVCDEKEVVLTCDFQDVEYFLANCNYTLAEYDAGLVPYYLSPDDIMSSEYKFSFRFRAKREDREESGDQEEHEDQGEGGDVIHVWRNYDVRPNLISALVYDDSTLKLRDF